MGEAPPKPRRWGLISMFSFLDRAHPFFPGGSRLFFPAGSFLFPDQARPCFSGWALLCFLPVFWGRGRGTSCSGQDCSCFRPGFLFLFRPGPPFFSDPSPFSPPAGIALFLFQVSVPVGPATGSHDSKQPRPATVTRELAPSSHGQPQLLGSCSVEHSTKSCTGWTRPAVNKIKRKSPYNIYTCRQNVN